MAKSKNFYVPNPPQPEPELTAKEKLAALVTTARGARANRLSAGVHSDQHGRPNRERTRGQHERAEITRNVHDLDD